jgi:hypothetical protein
MLPVIPHQPWSVPVLVEFHQLLPVLERVHRRPEAVMPVRDQLPLRDKSLERFLDEFFPVFEIIEDLLPEGEKPR